MPTLYEFVGADAPPPAPLVPPPMNIFHCVYSVAKPCTYDYTKSACHYSFCSFHFVLVVVTEVIHYMIINSYYIYAVCICMCLRAILKR